MLLDRIYEYEKPGSSSVKLILLAGLIFLFFLFLPAIQAQEANPPAPQMDSITPEKWSVMTDVINFIYDFNDLEGNLAYIEFDIVGPSPYDTPGNSIQFTFIANQSDPWEGWDSANQSLFEDMGISPGYAASLQRWTITINTTKLWTSANPWGQPATSSVWPAGKYDFYIEVGDYDGNIWGDMMAPPDYAHYVYSFHTIQPAIVAINNGGTVHVLNGVYTDTLLIDKMIKLIGQGSNTIIQPAATPQAGVYDIKLAPGSSNTIIENLVLDFNGADNTRGGTGIVVSDLNQPAVIKVQIINNIIYTGDGSGIGGTGIQTGKNSDVGGLLISGNTFYGDATGMGEGVYINPFTGSDAVKVYDNKFYGNLFSGVSIEASNVNVSGNVIDSNVTKGIYGIRFIELTGGQTFGGVRITSNDITNFTYGIRVGTAADVGSTLTAIIGSNTITNNDVGIWARYGADGSIHFNNILGNANYGINNVGTSTINATLNWWGSGTGPYHSSGNPSGTGDNVSSNVLFSNWLTSFWENKVYVDDYYDDSTPGWGIDHFNTVTAGVNCVFYGGNVKVKPGTYYEVLRIDKSLTLEATNDDASLTIISDWGASYSELLDVKGQTIQIASSNVVIDGLTIRRMVYDEVFPIGAVGNYGFPDLSNIELKFCEIKSMYNGFFFKNVENLTIYEMDGIDATIMPIFLESVNTYYVGYNEIKQRNSYGIVLKDCDQGDLDYNAVYEKVFSGVSINGCNDLLIAYGTFKQNREAFLINNSHDIEIKDMYIRENTYGVRFENDSNADIHDISFYNNTFSIYHAAYMPSTGMYYSSIQFAIDIVSEGNSVVVHPGIYEENIIIDKEIFLYGYSFVDQTIIDGGSGIAAIYVAKNMDVANVAINGLTLRGGINCLRTGKYMRINNLLVEDCVIEDSLSNYSVFIDPHQNSDMPPIREGVTPLYNPVVFKANIIRGGFYYQYTPFELYGLFINSQLIIRENDIDYIFLNGSIAVDIENNSLWSLGMQCSFDIDIGYNDFVNPGGVRYGIYLWSFEGLDPVKQIEIFENSIIGYGSFQTPSGVSGMGLVVAGAEDVLIEDNEIIANGEGIWVTNNYTNYNNDVCLGDVTNLKINGNDIDNSQTGIKLISEVNNGVIIENNIITHNGQGIWMQGANSNIIANNTISSGYYGIRFDIDSSNNLISNNCFSLNNGAHVFDLYSYNIWNISLMNGTNIMDGFKIGGNYWDDYEGEDQDSNGVGDTLIPYTCNGGIVNGGDFLPLMYYDENPPEVEVIYPNGGEIVNLSITILWNASDNEDPSLLIDLSYSNNGGLTWFIIALNEGNDGEYIWDISEMPDGSGYMIMVLARDNVGNENNDTSDAAFSIVGESHPGPEVNLVKPRMGYFYFFDDQRGRLFPTNAFVIGQITVEVEATSSLGIEKVEFYIDDELVSTQYDDEDNVYKWEWDEVVLFYHLVTIIAYDMSGQIGQDSIGITIFNLNIIP
jgi:parallel beta-helix repeat protein